MSDNIPVEIQLDILKRLPLKSLIRCRRVSKTWKSHIDSSAFIKKHSSYNLTQVQQRILVIYRELVDVDYGSYSYDFQDRYVSIVDDHTFPEQKKSLSLPTVNMIERPGIIGSSHGLLALYGRIFRNAHVKDVVVLWNISIRKAITVVLNVRRGIYGTAIGFGVCSETSDPKIVKITYVDHNETKGMESVNGDLPEVEVFTLRTKAWRRPYGQLPRKSVQFDDHNKVVIDGVFYWLAKDIITMGGEFRYIIISFDITSEEFGEVSLPNSFASMGHKLSLYKRGESLVVVVKDEHPINEDFDVWMMKDGVPKSFTKLCTITPNVHARLAGFRKSGEPIYENLVIGNQVIDESMRCSYYAYEYIETLLLVDQPQCMIYE